jgi:hypothetical protein
MRHDWREIMADGESDSKNNLTAITRLHYFLNLQQADFDQVVKDPANERERIVSEAVRASGETTPYSKTVISGWLAELAPAETVKAQLVSLLLLPEFQRALMSEPQSRSIQDFVIPSKWDSHLASDDRVFNLAKPNIRKTIPAGFKKPEPG